MVNPFEFLLKRLILLRNKLYLNGTLKRCRFRETVLVSVGNISVGGTGKTPTVMELAKYLLRKGFKVSVLLRGYRRKTKGTRLVSDGREVYLDVFDAGDEAYLYANLLKGVPVVVSENRCRGAELLVEEFKPDFILLDDALQHLRIWRNFDIVLLTPKDLKDKLLPFGRLREPPEVLWFKGDYCLLSKTNGRSEELERFCNTLGKDFGYLTVKGYKLFNSSLEEVDFENLRGKKVGVVAALGDNESFFNTVRVLGERYGFEPIEFLGFRDHHHHRDTYLDGNLLWITTFKDYFKLRERNKNLLVLDRIVGLPEGLLKRMERLAGGRN